MVRFEVSQPSVHRLNQADDYALALVVLTTALDTYGLPADGHQVVLGILEQLFEVSQDENPSLPLLDELAEEDRLA